MLVERRRFDVMGRNRLAAIANESTRLETDASTSQTLLVPQPIESMYSYTHALRVDLELIDF